jgi:hypothetical protein
MTERLLWAAVIFVGGFAQGFQAGTWRGIDATIKAENANAELVRFAEAARDANGWDYIFNGGNND